MENSELNWIHLSDLHIERSDTFNRKRVLDALWEDIERFLKDGVTLDFIVFTGDVAGHAKKEEYEIAILEFFDPLLERTAVTKDRVFIVPGNHDANWSITSKLKNPLPSIHAADDIHKLVEDPESRDLILSPFANYRNFVKAYFGSNYLKNDDPAFYTVHNLERGGVRVAVLGFNSAWLSGFNKDADGKVQDLGKLAISEFQIIKAQEEYDTAQIVIGLMHHPFDWLIESDRNIVEHQLTKSCHIVLRGHLHRPNVLNESSLSGHVVVIPAGAVFENRQFPNAYNLVRLDLRTGSGTVFLRRYNKERNEWQKDIESTGEKRGGQGVFRLRNFWSNATYESGEQFSSRVLSDYTCVFTDECKQDIERLNLTEYMVLDLVQAEFRGHLNYFLFDLEDYPLPVRSSFIVYLDKVQQRIEFRKIIPCTKNEAKLTSWNDILTLYRRATRLSYREQPENILFNKGLLGRTTELHLEMRKRIEKHFVNLENLVVSFSATANDRARGIAYHLQASERAEREVDAVVVGMARGDITHTSALALIVSELEKSLQHIHKIILVFPPVDIEMAG